MFLTSAKTPCCTRRAKNASTNWFLFSLPQLSSWMYSLSGRDVVAKSLNRPTRILRRMLMVRFGSCGYWRKSRNPSEPWPWTIAPVKCVRRCHRLTVDLLIFLRWGRLVADWSIPSMMMDIIVESVSALLLISWYLALWSLQEVKVNSIATSSNCSTYCLLYKLEFIS